MAARGINGDLKTCKDREERSQKKVATIIYNQSGCIMASHYVCIIRSSNIFHYFLICKEKQIYQGDFSRP